MLLLYVRFESKAAVRRTDELEIAGVRLHGGLRVIRLVAMHPAEQAQFVGVAADVGEVVRDPPTLRKSKVDFYDNYYHRGVADENFKYEQRTFMTSTKLSLFHCAHVPIEESGLLADY